ncbi:MAG TPA: hypothetical protein VJ302_25885 [Blastocatellia bacterium]|nr:hypothetical protein [Blastocatellia bacterium]
MSNTTATFSLPIQYLAFVHHFAALLELAECDVEDAETVVWCAALNLLADHLNDIRAEGREEETARLKYLVDLAQERERL